jgi:hypothetical protein
MFPVVDTIAIRSIYQHNDLRQTPKNDTKG